MDAKSAVAFAFEESSRVRGRDAKAAACVSLALHASRTVDGGPFFAVDGDVASRAIAALAERGRAELALQVAMWEADAHQGSKAEGPPGRGLAAYGKAKEWAEGKAGDANLAWIRDVPRAPAERHALAARLLLRARAHGASRERLAASALEAELCELPRPPAFPLIFEAAHTANSPAVVGRTLEALGVLDPASDAKEARVLLDRLRAALEIERMRAGGKPVAEAAAFVLGGLTPSTGPWLAPLGAHLAAATAREEGPAAGGELARKLQEKGGRGLPREASVSLDYVRAALTQGKGEGPLSLPEENRPSAPQLAEGACDAARALESVAPVLDALRLFDREDLGLVISDGGGVHLVKELVREGARAAAGARDLEGLRALALRIGPLGLRLPWDIYLRAAVVDAAAELAARAGGSEAWELGLSLASRGLPGFERAKLRGRAACEFIRATETADRGPRWVDPYFPDLRPGSKSFLEGAGE